MSEKERDLVKKIAVIACVVLALCAIAGNALAVPNGSIVPFSSMYAGR